MSRAFLTRALQTQVVLLQNRPYGTTAQIVLLMPYCIHGYTKEGRAGGATVQQPSFSLPRSSLSLGVALQQSPRACVQKSLERIKAALYNEEEKKALEEDFLPCLNQIKPTEPGSTPSPSFKSIYCTFCTSSECKKKKSKEAFDKMPPVSGTEKVYVCVCVPIYC